MVYDSEGKSGTKCVAIATSKYVPCGVFLRVQYWCYFIEKKKGQSGKGGNKRVLKCIFVTRELAYSFSNQMNTQKSSKSIKTRSKYT